MKSTDCERFAGHPPLVPGAGAIAWEQTLRLASRFVTHHRQHSHDAVVKATGPLGDGDGEDGHASTLVETLRDLGSHVVESSRDAKRRGEGRHACPMPLADLGRRAWPIALHGLMVELGWRMVDFAAAPVQGKAASQASVPLLDPLAG